MFTTRQAIENYEIHGDLIPGTPKAEGSTFEYRGVAVRYDGHGKRQVWDDPSDGWVWRYAPRYTILSTSAGSSPAPAGVRYAVVALDSTFAVAGQTGRAASTGKWFKATTWATREEAEAQVPHFSEIDPFDFKAEYNPRVVAIGENGPC